MITNVDLGFMSLCNEFLQRISGLVDVDDRLVVALHVMSTEVVAHLKLSHLSGHDLMVVVFDICTKHSLVSFFYCSDDTLSNLTLKW